jgi:hypothetical protein
MTGMSKLGHAKKQGQPLALALVGTHRHTRAPLLFAGCALLSLRLSDSKMNTDAQRAGLPELEQPQHSHTTAG